MRHRRRLRRQLLLRGIAAAIVFAAPVVTRGQPTAPALSAAARLRVWSSDQRASAVLGTLLGADSSQLRIELSNGSQVSYPWALVVVAVTLTRFR